ncbi:MAG TPA: carboxypeptidase-like regulatory domain-containing protein [Terriglobales bacterium]|nr:carboxypeptidase-like regulatory domain-containing protein [Terriglobales bacterium]
MHDGKIEHVLFRARISGHIRHSDGSPVPGIGVSIVGADGYDAETSDEEGYFRSDAMRPGKYVVGINPPIVPGPKYVGCKGKDCAPPIIYLYYPEMPNRSDSLVITLADDEKRDDIDFVMPTQ